MGAVFSKPMILFLALVAAVAAANNCTLTIDSQEFDLSSLRNETDFDVTTSEYVFHMNICGPPNSVPAACPNDTQVCQQWTGGAASCGRSDTQRIHRTLFHEQ